MPSLSLEGIFYRGAQVKLNILKTMEVLKFGGTSVQNIDSITKVIKIIRKHLKESKRLVVVSSAMGGVTNQLLEMAEKAELGEDVQGTLKTLEARHLEVIRHFIPAKYRNPAVMQVKLFLNELEDLLQGVRAVEELSPKTKDQIAAYGELCSNFMLAGIMEQEIPETQFVDARNLVLTDSRFGKARIQKQKTAENIKDFFASSSAKLLCVTGFIGANEKGQTTTLGRGGSDYTAAVFASTLDADEIQIWTDVDGFMTADPRVVKEAYSLSEITYTEAKELSYFGAKVIYPPTMVPAFEKRIPIYIRNTFNMDFPGTLIHTEAKNQGDYVRGITSIRDINLINIQGTALVGNTNFSGRLFALLSRYDINIVLITQASSEHSITLAVAPEDAGKTLRILKREFEMELMAHKIDMPEIVRDLAVVAIVGEQMKSTVGISGRFFNTLGRHEINVAAIAQGSSEYNVSTVISKKNLNKALNVVHDEFFLPHIKILHVFTIGTGNIGSTFLDQLQSQATNLLEEQDLRIQVLGITNTRKMLLQGEAVELENWRRELDEDGEEADFDRFVDEIIAMNLPNSVLVDNSASAAVVKAYERILSSGISIVTCNKIGNSSSLEQYKTFKDAARMHHADFYYEANVGAGLPIISMLKDLINSGDRIVKIEAILSGTISYIFNNFTGNHHFYEIVKEAQEKGYTEPDPRDDLSGLDFMRKMLILARDSGIDMEMEEIEFDQLLPEPCVQADSVEEFYVELEKADEYFEKLKKQAERDNKVLRYIGVLEKGKVRVELKAIDDSHPFYNLSGSDNIIAFVTQRYSQDYPLVVKGPGAGAQVTAGGVFADLVRVGKK